MLKTQKTSKQYLPIYIIMLSCIVWISLSSCSKNDTPKGEWILDCGIVEHIYGDYHMIHHMNLDLDKPTIPVEDDLNDKTIMAYGSYDFSTMDHGYKGYIDSVAKISKNVYVLHSVDTGWGYTSTDTLRYFPEKKAFTFGFGDDMLFVKEGSGGISTDNSEASIPATSGKKDSPLVIWIVIIAAVLFVLCVGIKISGELDGWEYAVPLSAALAILVSIVGYNIVFKEIIPAQLQLSSSDGVSGILWLFGSVIVIAVSYFWSISIIRKGIAEEYQYVSIGCGQWVMAILIINVFIGIATAFQPFRDMSSGFIDIITFKRDIIAALMACSLIIAFILTIIQIVKFYNRLNKIVATMATVLFPVYVSGAVAMCVSSIPILIMVIIAFLAIAFLFNGAKTTLNSVPKSEPQTVSSYGNTPKEIEFVEPGSIAKTSASHIGCGIYMTSDGRKFEKDGDYVKPYVP